MNTVVTILQDELLRQMGVTQLSLYLSEKYYRLDRNGKDREFRAGNVETPL
jgi:hypothetical protein